MESPVVQLMLELSVSVHAPREAQNSERGIFQLWSYPFNESSMETRALKKSSVESGSSGTSSSTQPCTLTCSLASTPADTQVGSHAALQMPSLCWPSADGDFFKGRNKLQVNSCSTTENNNAETLPVPVCNLRYGNSSVGENLTDESDLSENEKTNDTLLSYFKKMDMNLKPEKIDNVEESFTEEPTEAFRYPDFLPPPFDTLDLHKLALSKCENWKATAEPPDSSTEHLITRLLQLERLQHTTIQKERLRLQMLPCASAVSEPPSSSKAVSKVRQPKLPDSLSLQASCVDKSREKAKPNSGSGKLEQNASRWHWSNASKYKWNPKTPALKLHTQLTATYDTKNPQSPILDSRQELSPKPSTSQTSQSLVKMVSRRALPPRSLIPVSSVALSFPENHKEETKTPRARKKLHQRAILLKRPFYIQKLNYLSPSFIGKAKYSFIDQK